MMLGSSWGDFVRESDKTPPDIGLDTGTTSASSAGKRGAHREQRGPIRAKSLIS
jgi:hypothetical protein